MNRNTDTFTQMGGEGVPWVGQMHFTEEQHIFANLGDGTYYHSGILAIRQAVAAKANMTYKILYNDAVAMTGGQPTEGHITPWQIAQQLEGEGVSMIRVVTDEPEKYAEGTPWPKGTTIHHRDDLDKIQRHLREEKGVSILIYDQTCAAEKRRRRKRGTFPDPAKRVIINDLVCEGCGDCSVKSNCLSVEPIETEFGRKRTINQSTCNKDYSCVNGFCPSFVTVEGGELRKAAPHAAENPAEGLPAPAPRELNGPYRILITGIGGTGVVTIGAIVGMAAHLEGKGISVLDQAGLAQKGGAVTSHVHIAPQPEDINAVRIPAGRADLLIGCDMVVSGSYDSLAKFDVNVAHAVINAHPSPTMDFTLNPDAPFPVKDTLDHIREAIGPDQCDLIEASEIATTLLGDSIATNLFMLGFAYQKGLIPLSEEALLRAVELNGVAVPFNKKAFGWGRVMAADPDRVMKEVAELKGPALRMEPTDDLEEMISRRVEFLTGYQNARYARRYSDFIGRVRDRESEVLPGSTALTEAVVRSYFKLLAYKDEYEVARLYTDTSFMKRVERMMDGDYHLKFHLAPPLFAKRDPDTGELKKKEYGQYMLKAFGFLAKFKGLRGTPLDVFGYQEERKVERALIKEFEKTVTDLLDGLTVANHAIAVEIAALPMQIRGYGHVKDKAIAIYRGDLENLLTSFKSPEPQKQAAE
jgi:indolepyruvate ferredoxin oxidoreductase